MNSRRWVLAALLGLCLTPLLTYAQNVKAGYKSLEKKEFDKAFEVFFKSLEKSPVEGSLALSDLRSTRDSANRYYSLDTAFLFVRDAESIFCRNEQKDRDGMIKDGISFEKILGKRDTLYLLALEEARATGEVAALEHYLEFYNRYPRRREVELERDSLAFVRARENGRSEAFLAFTERYPTAKQFPDARKLYDDALFSEVCTEGTLEAYLNFLQKYPNSFHVGAVEDSVFAREIPSPPTVEALFRFAQTYPRNRNYTRAWRTLYDLVCYDFMEETYLGFLKQYPTFPSKSLIYEDLDLARETVVHQRQGGQMGYVRASDGKLATEFVYSVANPFSENVAAVSKKTRWQYISKAGAEVIAKNLKAADDFHSGAAAAATDEGYGLLNKKGEWILSPTLEELVYREAARWAGRSGNEWFLVSPGGERIGTNLFAGIGVFRGGLASVIAEGRYGAIDTAGNWVVPPVFDTLEVTRSGAVHGRKGTKLAVGSAKLALDSLDVAEVIVLPSELVLVRYANGRYRYLDAVDGWQEPQAQWRWQEPLRGWLAAGARSSRPLVVDPTQKLGILDNTLNPVWAPEAEGIIGLEASKALHVGIKKAGKWGIIDAVTGTVILPATYDSLAGMDGPFGAIASGGRWGAAALDGRLVVPVQYASVRYLSELGLFHVTISDKSGLVNDRGLEVLKPQFDRIEPVAESLVRVEVTGKQALIRLEATTIKYIWEENGFPTYVK